MCGTVRRAVHLPLDVRSSGESLRLFEFVCYCCGGDYCCTTASRLDPCPQPSWGRGRAAVLGLDSFFESLDERCRGEVLDVNEDYEESEVDDE